MSRERSPRFKWNIGAVPGFVSYGPVPECLRLIVTESTSLESRVQRLHDRAEQVRAVGEAMHDVKYRRTMLLTAESYQRMANQLESVSRHVSLPSEPSPQLSPESEIAMAAEPK